MHSALLPGSRCSFGYKCRDTDGTVGIRYRTASVDGDVQVEVCKAQGDMVRSGFPAIAALRIQALGKSYSDQSTPLILLKLLSYNVG